VHRRSYYCVSSWNRLGVYHPSIYNTHRTSPHHLSFLSLSLLMTLFSVSGTVPKWIRIVIVVVWKKKKIIINISLCSFRRSLSQVEIQCSTYTHAVVQSPHWDDDGDLEQNALIIIKYSLIAHIHIILLWLIFWPTGFYIIYAYRFFY